MAGIVNKENLNPAVKQNEDHPNQMSAEEFRRTLITWFEDRGLLSELRTHLRRQMIGMLKDTTLGQTISNTNSKVSPKTHAINLLIAEFLLKQSYHYSLSVFSTEVPFFINILPEFTSSFIGSDFIANDNVPTTSKNFGTQNFWDILESLGFNLDSRDSKQLQEMYYNSTEQSLLTCMVHSLAKYCKIKSKQPVTVTYNEELSKYEPWLKDIYNLLVHYEVHSNFISDLGEQIKEIFVREQIKIRSEEQKKYINKQDSINKDITNREIEIKRILGNMENIYHKERQKIKDERIKEFNILEKLRTQLTQQKAEYEVKNDGLQKKEDIIRKREKELDEQLTILKSRMKLMEKVYDSVIEENKMIAQLRQDLQHQGDESEEIFKKLHNEYQLLRSEIHTTKKVINKFNGLESQYVHKEQQTLPTSDVSEQQLLKGILERVQNENAALRVLNSEQQRRLDDVSLRNSMLLNDLENCQATINFLTRTNSRRGTITVPPLLPSPPHRIHSRPSNLLNGGGENLGFVPQPPSPPVYRYAYTNQFRDYIRRKAPKRLVVHSSSSNSSSPTEDVIQEARQRLRQLEDEAEQVDRNYREFRERQSQENLPSFSLHNLHESVLRLRNGNTESGSSVAINLNTRTPFGPTIQLDSQESITRPNTSTANFINPVPEASTSFNGFSLVQNHHFTPSHRSMPLNLPSTSFDFNFTSNNKSGKIEASRFDFNFSRNKCAAEKIERVEEKVTKQIEEIKDESAGSSDISHLKNLSISSIDVSSDESDTDKEKTAEDK